MTGKCVDALSLSFHTERPSFITMKIFISAFRNTRSLTSPFLNKVTSAS